jgi:hypothetical protein
MDVRLSQLSEIPERRSRFGSARPFSSDRLLFLLPVAAGLEASETALTTAPAGRIDDRERR